jgi:hypothetical protein
MGSQGSAAEHEVRPSCCPRKRAARGKRIEGFLPLTLLQVAHDPLCLTRRRARLEAQAAVFNA